MSTAGDQLAALSRRVKAASGCLAANEKELDGLRTARAEEGKRKMVGEGRGQA